jgi:hypothetical protein
MTANKTFSVFALSVLLAVFLVGFASALSLSASTSTITFSETVTSGTFTVTGDTNFNLTSPLETTIRDSNGDSLTIDLIPSGNTSDVTSIDFNVVAGDSSKLNLGLHETEFVITGVNASGSDTDSVIVTFEFEKGLHDLLEIPKTKISFDTLEGFGDNEDFWYPFDEVEVEFDVDNRGSWDIDDIEITACLYDVSDGRCILDEGDMDLTEDDFDLEAGEDITVKMTFLVDPEELETGNTDYILYIGAVGEIDDNSAGAPDGEDTGAAANFPDLEIRTDEEFVIVNDITITPNVLSCGETFELTADVWNVGDKDFEDDEVFLRIFNEELGINEVVEFNSGIDALDYEVISLLFEVPKDADEKTYGIRIIAYDDEDLESGDVYENSEDDEAEYVGLVTVKGNCIGSAGEVTISASLESEARAGRDLVVKATITNNANELRTLSVSAAEFSTFANSASADLNTIILGAGESGEVLLTLDVKGDASGEYVFYIETLSEGVVERQPVSVSIEPKAGFLGITGFAIEGNWPLYGLGLLNIILVVIIVIVAIRVARR